MISYVFNKRKSRLRTDVPDCIHNGAMNSVTNPYCVSNATYLANIEMQQVIIVSSRVCLLYFNNMRIIYNGVLGSS